MRRAIIHVIAVLVSPVVCQPTANLAADVDPARGVLPKDETQASRFLERFPEYDGRGVVVAVFDSGVDPGAAGLQKTPQGLPKIVDMIDGTGSGDVDTATVRHAADGYLEGLSGRKLSLPKAWQLADRDFHVGLKSAYDFFPSPLINRLKKERRERFIEQQRLEVESLQRLLSGDDGASKKRDGEQSASVGKKELRQRLEQLQNAGRQFKDPGPVYDCVVFHDRGHWRAVVDTDEDGDLGDEKLMTNYRVHREHSTFRGGADLNFAANIYDNGNRLSLIVDCSPHGTHVAATIAGYHAGSPELNGIAPGAQLVSVKIGDSRVDGMETVSGLVRGLKAVVDNRCDMVNMSYGEPTSTPDRGRVIRLYQDLVERHNVLFFAAAGNEGPGLSTVIAPGGSSSALIGIGAHLSPLMAAAQYSIPNAGPNAAYSWSSRGPSTDGDLGVDLFAPGGAIAPVAQWTQSRSMQMHGTSMATPNACGVTALMISALKAREIPYTQRTVRDSLKATARKVEGVSPFAQGAGLIQIDRAFDHHANNEARNLSVARYDVRLPRDENARGIYLREWHETQRAAAHYVSVTPVFAPQTPGQTKVDFQIPVRFECDADWVTAGEFALFASDGHTMKIHVDPTKLQPGAHFAEVTAFDRDDPKGGPIFCVPITVVKPEHCDGTASINRKAQLAPNQIHRGFIAVPAGATWAEWSICRKSSGPSQIVVAHAVQLAPGNSFEAHQTQSYYRMVAGDVNVMRFSVVGGGTLETCLASNWSESNPIDVDFELRFHGVNLNPNAIGFTPGNSSARVTIANVLPRETVSLKPTLDSVRHVYMPNTAEITPGDPDRDRLPNGQPLNILTLTYSIESDSTGAGTIRFPQTDELLYESSLGGRFWMLFDSAKRRIAAGDVTPTSASLGKGKYTLRLQFRHEDNDVLEKWKKTPLCIDRSLDTATKVQLFASRADVVSGQGAISKLTLASGERTELTLAASSAATSGNALLGAITVSSHSPAGTPDLFQWKVPLVIPRTATDSTASPASSSDGTLEEAVRDVKIDKLRSLDSEQQADEFDRLADRLAKEYPDHLPILIARLHRADDVLHRKERLPHVIASADAVISRIDKKKLAAYFGKRQTPDDEKARKTAEQMKSQKKALIDALYRKGRALGYMELPDVLEKYPIKDPKTHDAAFENNFDELQEWVDPTSKEYFLLTVRRYRRKEQFGEALALIQKHISETNPEYWHYKKRRDIFELLGWKHLAEMESRWLLIRFPKQYEPF